MLLDPWSILPRLVFLGHKEAQFIVFWGMSIFSKNFNSYLLGIHIWCCLGASPGMVLGGCSWQCFGDHVVPWIESEQRCALTLCFTHLPGPGLSFSKFGAGETGGQVTYLAHVRPGYDSWHHIWSPLPPGMIRECRVRYHPQINQNYCFMDHTQWCYSWSTPSSVLECRSCWGGHPVLRLHFALLLECHFNCFKGWRERTGDRGLLCMQPTLVCDSTWVPRALPGFTPEYRVSCSPWALVVALACSPPLVRFSYHFTNKKTKRWEIV